MEITIFFLVFACFFLFFCFFFLKGIQSWLDSAIDSMDMNLSKFWEMLKDREAWSTAVHGHNLATEQQQILKQVFPGGAWGLGSNRPRSLIILVSTQGQGPPLFPYEGAWFYLLTSEWETGYLQVGRLSLPLNVKSLVSVTFRARFITWGFPDGSDRKESACNAEDLGWIPGLGRSPGEGHGNPLQYYCPENPYGQRKLAGYSPWSCGVLRTAQHYNLGYVSWAFGHGLWLDSGVRYTPWDCM